MEIVKKYGKSDLAMVYIAKSNGKFIEFVESIQPPIPRDEKWVIIISTLFGCPVGCKFCDAGIQFNGKLNKEEMFAQINYLVKTRFNGEIKTKKFKIQFSRVGEPSLNNNVLNVLEELPEYYPKTNIIPSISTIAPVGCDDFFNRLLEIKNKHYKKHFQLQFSIHSTDIKMRDDLIPIQKWSFEEIGKYGRKFYNKNGKKITLNFAISEHTIIDAKILVKYFPTDIFIIKITPVNPTMKSYENNIKNIVYNGNKKLNTIIYDLKKVHYDVILSIGELEENKIGSNCGQYIQYFMKNKNNNYNTSSYEYIDQ